MTIRNDTEKWIFIFLATLFSVVASLLISWAIVPTGLDRATLVPTVTVPLIVAPVATLWVAKMMLRIHELNRKLEYLVRHDQMTGLLTRGAFFNTLETPDAAKTGSIMMLDIDRFKTINDSYGHHTGDRIIRQVADILKGKTKPDGSAARFGGEEFVTFYPGECIQHAEIRAEAIRKAVERQSILVSGKELSCTLSIGVDIFDGSRPLDEVLRSADEALYEAKENGRNRVVRRTSRSNSTMPSPGGPL